MPDYADLKEFYSNFKIFLLKLEKKIRAYFSAKGSDIYTRFIRRMFLFFILACIIAALTSLLTLLIVGIAKPLTKVPNVTGMNVVDAAEAVQDRGLNVRIDSKFDTNSEKLTVLEQVPGSGITVKKDRTVVLIISMGKDVYKAPSLSGMKLEDAQDLLTKERIGYDVSIIQSKDYALDAVISQDVTPGVETDRDVKMHIVVNSDIGENEYRVDDFTKQALDMAVKTLIAASIHPIINKVPTKDPSEDGVVLSQNIKQGSVVTKNSDIILQVGVYGETDKDTANNNYYLFTYFMDQSYNGGSNSSPDTQDSQNDYAGVKITKSDDQVQQEEIYNQDVKFGDTIILTFKAFGNAKIDLFINNNLIKEIPYGTN